MWKQYFGLEKLFSISPVKMDQIKVVQVEKFVCSHYFYYKKKYFSNPISAYNGSKKYEVIGRDLCHRIIKVYKPQFLNFQVLI